MTTVVSDTVRLRTGPGYEMRDITGDVQACVDASDLKSGIASVFVPGATGGLTTIEFESGLVADFERLFDEIAPEAREYQHNLRWHDGNGHAHVRASLVGPSLTVHFDDGRLELGTWQQIVFLDFDPPARERTLKVKLIGA